MLSNMYAGNLTERLQLTRSDELGNLGRALDNFADNLQNEILTSFNKLAVSDFTFAVQG